jgi:hypothetical protein
MMSDKDDQVDLNFSDSEEVSITGGRTQYDQAPPSNAPGDDMSARRAHLQDVAGPGCSDVDLVDAILQLPAERLIPWEVCSIPSNGIYYGWPSRTVEVRAMGQTAEKVLANQRLAQSGQSIDYLFRECVRYPDPNFDPMDLLVGDRMFLLYYLRGITHGNMYEFAMTCPNPQCGKSSTHSYDLNNLASTIRQADPSIGVEPYKVVLPYLSESIGREFWVGLRFLRGRDTNNMIAMRRTKKRAFAAPAIRAGKSNPFKRQDDAPVDDTLTENLQLVIVSLMGVQDRVKINSFVQRMHATDTAAIREWLREYSPGIESTVTLNCPECGQEFTVELPLTESFFRPTQKR